MVDFEWYRSYVSIYKHNSVSEAAKERIMTQPAMSQHLAALEAEVGQSLFTRVSRKMIPTERGKELYSELAPLIESLEEKTMGLKGISLPTMPVIRFGSAHEFFRELILPNIHEYTFRMVAQFGTAPMLIEQLKEDKVDLIVTSKKFQTPGIEHEKFMEEEFVLVAPKETIVPDFKNLIEMEKWLSEQNWISYGLELPIIRRFWREHLNKRPLIKPVHVLPDLHTILSAIEHGNGISLLPTYILNNTNNGSAIILEKFKVSNELYIAYKTKHKSSPELRMAIDLIKSLS
ncbi:MAG: LysR family transcriptional regulator [Bacillota bacterium]